MTNRHIETISKAIAYMDDCLKNLPQPDSDDLTEVMSYSHDLEFLERTIKELDETRDYIIKIKAQNTAYLTAAGQPIKIIVSDQTIRKAVIEEIEGRIKGEDFANSIFDHVMSSPKIKKRMRGECQ